MLNAAAMRPVLELPEPGLDDTAAYDGYRTRIFRDAAGSPVQVYLDEKSGRVVLLWADSADESAAFSVRDTTGVPAAMDWGAPAAEVSREAGGGGERTVTCRLRFPASPVMLGHVAMGSMRWERDLQYQGRHLAPFDSTLPRVPEVVELFQRLARLDPAEQTRHLHLLGDSTLESLRARLRQSGKLSFGDTLWTVRFERPSLDARARLALEIQGSRKACVVEARANALVIRPRRPGPFTLAFIVRTNAPPLTPIGRERIFTADFLDFCERVKHEHPGSAHARRLERELRGMELLCHEEKLMAGLPNFATYFGRDMMMTALMMQEVWRPEMLEHVIGAALGKLSPAGEASHEEALGGQAVRENAGEYAALLARAEPAAPASRDSLLGLARSVIAHIGRTRESYAMVDETFQLPVIAARYLALPDVPAGSKRTFLLAPARSDEPGTRLAALLRNFDCVVARAAPYVAAPEPVNMVPFRDAPGGGFLSGSWRDSRAGYAGGRFAMDVNVVWVPEALRAIDTSLAALAALGFSPDTLIALAPRRDDGAFAGFARDPASRARALERWAGARRAFAVSLPAARVRERLGAWLAWLPEGERTAWRAVADTAAIPDTLRFLALSLDSTGRPIPVMNSDPASLLFMAGGDADAALEWIEPLMRPFPVGLFVPELGILAANDALAPREVREAFRADPYHSPRVVWGREVNLLVLGLEGCIRRDRASPPSPRAADLRRDVDRVRTAADASGLRYSELWSYRIERGAVRPARFGASSDVQLWSLTDLAIQFALAREGSPP
jgi:hypothetical protein